MSDSYCAAPWRGLHINLDGDIRLCCAGQPGSFGNIKSHDLTALTDSPYLREIRQSISQGHLHPTYCESCIDSAGRGERQWFNETHQDIDLRSSAIDAPHRFQSIDLRWNNTCNLACTYCGPYFSSTWAGIHKIKSAQPPARQFDKVTEQIMAQAPVIKTAMLVGGEPLLIPHNQRLLDSLPESTTVVVITNLSVPLEQNPIFQNLSERTNVNWNVSFENVGDRFEFVRRGASWCLMCDNLDTIASLFPAHTISISAIYHVFNCTRLVEFRQAMQDRNINVNWNTISQDYLDPRSHAEPVRQAASSEITKLLSGSLDLTDTEINFFRRMCLDLKHGLGRNGILSDLQTHVAQDQDRFAKLWPELQEALA